MAFMRDLDEVLLRLASLFLRAFEIFGALFILSAVAKFMNDLDDIDVVITGGAVAVEAISCAAAAYGFLVFLPTFCGGAIFFKCVSAFDFVFAGLFIFCAVQFGDDTTNTCADFGKKYFDANTSAPINYDCGLIRAVFAFCIINIVLFAFSFAVSIGLRQLDLSPDGFRGQWYNRHGRHREHNHSNEEMTQAEG